MSKTVQWKRGNANVSSTYTGPEGELTVNTTNWTLNIHDGVTQGGHPASFSLGNLDVSNQTISGTVSNTNIVIDPNGTGIVVLNNGVSTDGNITAPYFVGNGSLLTGIQAGSNYGNANVAAYLPTYAGNLSANRLDVANSIIITSNVARSFFASQNKDTQIVSTDGISSSSIYLWANNGRMSFNTVSNAFDFNFNGQLSATDFTASKSSATGYSFYTPGEGLAGFTHVNGPPSYIRIVHDGIEYTKFYANYTTQTIGNLVISSNANVFGTFPNAFVQVYANINSYSQLVHQNLNSGPRASSDFVATANNGDDFTYFVGMGIASNNYSFPGYGVVKPNDAYLLVVGNDYLGPSTGNVGNLVLGSSNGNIKFYVGAAEDANVITELTSTSLVPGANVTYSLGSATRQWKDLWLSNNTLYLGGTPITVANGVLSVNGSPVSGTGNYSNANVAAYLPVYSGNVSANNFIGNIQGNIQGLIGSITNLDSGNFNVENIGALVANVGVNIGAGGYNNLVVLPTDVIIQNVPLTVAGNILSTVAGGLHITANTVANGTAQTWNFGTDGRLTFPGTPRIATDTNNFEVQAAENINFEANAAFNIYTDTSGGTYQWQFDTTGNLTVPGTIFVPSGASISGTGSPAPRMSGFSSVEAASLYSGTGNVTVRASYGNLRIGDIGNVGSSNAGVTSSTTFSIVTDNLATPHEWVFDANGTLTAPGNITSTTGNVLVKNIRTIDQEVHLGQGAGQSNQGAAAIAIGRLAGNTSQGAAAVAIGEEAGNIAQGSQSIAIGTVAGRSNQGTDAIAIGTSAGAFNQLEGAIAIGQSAGVIDQGVFAVAIGSGAGYQYQANNSIAITATGTQLSPTESGFYIDPVRSVDGSNVSLSYNTSTKEITYSANTFVSNTYVPSTAGSAGTIGQISFDGSYVYVCVANNTWRRANLSSW